jgi:hypothetical protein
VSSGITWWRWATPELLIPNGWRLVTSSALVTRRRPGPKDRCRSASQRQQMSVVGMDSESRDRTSLFGTSLRAIQELDPVWACRGFYASLSPGCVAWRPHWPFGLGRRDDGRVQAEVAGPRHRRRAKSGSQETRRRRKRDSNPRSLSGSGPSRGRKRRCQVRSG